jgi:hypothetical protein
LIIYFEVLIYLTNITERMLFRRRVMKRETVVFGSKFVGVVDTVVAVGAEGGFIGGAE